MENIWKLLFQTAEGIRNLQDRNSGDHPRPEITISQIRVLGCVFFSPSGRVRVNEIARDLNLTSGRVSQIVDKLVNSGLLERIQDPEDRRAVSVSLSAAGAAKRQKLDREFEMLMKKLMRNISPEKQKVFHEVLCTLLNEIEEEKIR